MSTVKIVANKKTGKMYQATTSGKFQRVQLSGEGINERDGFFTQTKQVGFAYFATEDMAKAFIATAIDDVVSGKIVYVDSLSPIMEESPEYGKQYPYPFRANGVELTLEQRLQVQAKAIEAGLALQQSGKAIYRKKMYTTDLTRQSVILSPDNLDDVNAFVATVLASTAPSAEEKQARINQLKAIAKAKRTPAEVQELAELLED